MSPVVLVLFFTFVSAAALIGSVVVLLSESNQQVWARRLGALTGSAEVGAKHWSALLRKDAFNISLGGLSTSLAGTALRVRNLNLMFEQADPPISAQTFLGISAGLGLCGSVGAAFARAPREFYPLVAIAFGSLPLIWLLLRRRSRLKKFSVQLPDALQMLARALRSGHSLPSAIQFIVSEMRAPIATEFAIVWQKQNMGLPIEQGLLEMNRRISNDDLKFFVALVNMQRQTGGNLAEMLDQISYVVRERFKILGLVKALTGEGRISGIVLMVLPVVLFFVIYCVNPTYVMVLFTDALGRKMLGAAAILQLMGAFTINKIVNIKV